MKIKKNTIAALIFALGLFLFFAFVVPTYDAIKDTQSAIEARKTHLAERQALVAKVAALNDEYQKNTVNISKIDDFIPAQFEQDQIVSSIHAISNESGIRLSELSIAEPQNTPGGLYRTSVISVNVNGQYRQFTNFLELLEHNLRLYDVSEIAITESTGVGSSGLQFQIKILVNILNK